MKIDKLEDMVRGWFVGDFEPSALRTKEFEVGIRRYNAGDAEAAHVHRQTLEITAIMSGEARMAGRTLVPGDIITIEPGDATAFEALTDCVTVVVKTPSLVNDKFPVDHID
ncbi:hypothetical protein ASE60_31375 [Ensifer sp. Root278]|nr:hypothetical protein ASE60_31375 [Ensifer sp. Root278]